jgi:muramoyltetrapeptide carboxypeptidase LdcA involved in peptidoglycan recycling
MEQGTNTHGEWSDADENKTKALLQRLKNSDPLFDERVEFGKMLMRHYESFTPEEKKRYEELKSILRTGYNAEK